MSVYKTKINPWTKKLQWVIDANLLKIKGTVDTYNDLPLTGNTENDCYITKDTDFLYTWNNPNPSGLLTDWIQIGSTASIDWSVITNKPSSLVADIDDAVTKKHTRLHDIDDTNDHNGVSGAIEDNLVSFDANGLPKDSGKSIPTGDIVGTSDSQILTNKELNDNIETMELTAGENVSAGDICYLKSDGKMWKTDADAEATSKGLICMATETILADATGTFLRKGKYTTSGLTTGDTLYLDTSTAGTWTNIAPSGSGDIVRIIGYALSTTVLYFDPDKSYLEIS